MAGTDGIHLELLKYGGNKLFNRIYELVRQMGGVKNTWRMERNNDSSYIQKGDRDRCENYRGIALGNAACKLLMNIILEKN